MASTFDGDVDSLRALGHGVLGLVNAAILLAIVAVVLASGSAAVTVLQNLFEFLAWLVSGAVTPVTGGTITQLGTVYAEAGGYPEVGSGVGAGGVGSSGSTASTTSTGAGTGTSTTGTTGTVDTGTFDTGTGTMTNVPQVGLDASGNVIQSGGVVQTTTNPQASPIPGAVTYEPMGTSIGVGGGSGG